jgi:hypothetical protein
MPYVTIQTLSSCSPVPHPASAKQANDQFVRIID